ncbi:unnamed protein product [Mytilus coruscus]|uniref:Reverse transcriptase Ty1/copia-type domain-containing protein n=1 Tax=Mytilus coruscus TaxID=42192 RepID=A0A6J8AI61_MYTCO|nr:unnamed protein product [Mytilus coruscus]
MLFLQDGLLQPKIIKHIKSAFLQGKILDRDVFLKPPPESNSKKGRIWRLKHCLYGLKDGARQFYFSAREELLSLGCKQCSLDLAVFVKHTDQRLSGIICCHVDDFLQSGDEQFEEVMRKLRTRFVAGKIEEKNFSYVGSQIHQNKSGIILDHSTYMKKIDNTTIEPSRAAMKQDVLNTSEQTLYRKLIGQINLAVQVSRPDLSFEMKDMSTKLKEGTVAHLIRAIKADTSLGNISNGTGSTESHVIWIVDNKSNSCPITWKANKIKRVVRSTIAADALSLQDGLESSFYHRRIIEDILGLKHQTIPIEAVYSTKLVDYNRLRIDIAAIAESLASKEVDNIKWCPGDKQLANCMTKFGASSYELLQVIQTRKNVEGLCLNSEIIHKILSFMFVTRCRIIP